jgi:hypothetical protein
MDIAEIGRFFDHDRVVHGAERRAPAHSPRRCGPAIRDSRSINIGTFAVAGRSAPARWPPVV